MRPRNEQLATYHQKIRRLEDLEAAKISKPYADLRKAVRSIAGTRASFVLAFTAEEHEALTEASEQIERVLDQLRNRVMNTPPQAPSDSPETGGDS